jgi:hypothetical protein
VATKPVDTAVKSSTEKNQNKDTKSVKPARKPVKKAVKKESSTPKENIETKASEKTVSKPVIDSDEKAS